MSITFDAVYVLNQSPRVEPDQIVGSLEMFIVQTAIPKTAINPNKRLKANLISKRA